MEPLDYYNDRKFCPTCRDYRPYLMSVSKSYCVECGGEVRLFSETDWAEFHESMAAKKPRGGRPRKDQRDSKSA